MDNYLKAQKEYDNQLPEDEIEHQEMLSARQEYLEERADRLRDQEIDDRIEKTGSNIDKFLDKHPMAEFND